jgi:hypothetical protein
MHKTNLQLPSESRLQLTTLPGNNQYKYYKSEKKWTKVICSIMSFVDISIAMYTCICVHNNKYVRFKIKHF